MVRFLSFINDKIKVNMVNTRSIDALTLNGGWICLDFINTVHDRSVENPFEYLSDYGKFLNWSVKVELLSSSEKNELETIAKKDSGKADHVLRELISARELLYDLFLPITRNQKPADTIQTQFNILLEETMSQLELQVTDKLEARQQWKSKSSLKSPLFPIIKSAYDLLISNTSERIKECGACGWLFLDQSKNKSRRWCSMETCGSNVKAKRYYYRNKKRNN